MISQKIVLLAVSGALGTLARYGLAGFVQKISGTPSPWGTLAVNIIGCFAAGILFSIFEYKWTISTETRVLILIGFMGAFTTFSAFILETEQLIRSSEWTFAITNVVLQNGLGLVVMIAGMKLGRMI